MLAWGPQIRICFGPQKGLDRLCFLEYNVWVLSSNFVLVSVDCLTGRPLTLSADTIMFLPASVFPHLPPELRDFWFQPTVLLPPVLVWHAVKSVSWRLLFKLIPTIRGPLWSLYLLSVTHRYDVAHISWLWQQSVTEGHVRWAPSAQQHQDDTSPPQNIIYVRRLCVLRKQQKLLPSDPSFLRACM